MKTFIKRITFVFMSLFNFHFISIQIFFGLPCSLKLKIKLRKVCLSSHKLREKKLGKFVCHNKIKNKTQKSLCVIIKIQDKTQKGVSDWSTINVKNVLSLAENLNSLSSYLFKRRKFKEYLYAFVYLEIKTKI